MKHCACCGRKAKLYGSAIYTAGGIAQDDSQEVCVVCLESGCECGGMDLVNLEEDEEMVLIPTIIKRT